jgi:hypothetical protein
MKTCKFQGRKEYGCIICKKDGSRRKAENCTKRKCPKWQRTRLDSFLWWWMYGTIYDLFKKGNKR